MKEKKATLKYPSLLLLLLFLRKGTCKSENNFYKCLVSFLVLSINISSKKEITYKTFGEYNKGLS